MTDESIRKFKSVADVAILGSVSKAASLNKISQSAMSQGIQAAEREYGHRIFDRSARPVKPTALGELYVQFCIGIVAAKRTLDRVTADQVAK